MGIFGSSRPRTASGCSSFYSSKHGGREVIIIAGGLGPGAASNYEVWDYTQQGAEWDTLRKEIFKIQLGPIESVR